MASLTERRSADLSARDFFIQETFGFERCESCNGVPLEARATVLLPASTVKAQDPTGVLLGRYVQPTRTPSGELYFTLRRHRACAACKKAMIQMMQSRYPDTAAVIMEEPPSDRIVVAVG